MSVNSLLVKQLSGSLFVAYDICNLFPSNKIDVLVNKRVSENWLSYIVGELKNYDTLGYEQPYFIESEYGKTDRAPRNTFSQRHAKKLLPLKINNKVHTKHIEKNLEYFASCIYVSPQGGVCVRIEINTKDVTELSIKDCIDQYNRFLQRKDALVKSSLEQFVKLWNESFPDDNVSLTRDNFIRDNAFSYEVLDFDFALNTKDGIEEIGTIKGLFKTIDKTAAKELAALSRMSLASVSALKDIKLNDFQKTDIGGREDELWSINRERMIRHHPDKHIVYNIAFFNDIKEAVAILVCQQAVFDYLDGWITEQRREVADHLISGSDENYEKDLLEKFNNATQVTNLLIEPIIIQKNVRHEFYVRAISLLIDKLELNSSVQRASNSLSNFSKIIESISNYNSSSVASATSKSQLALSQSAEKLSRATIWLTILAVVLMVVQIYVAFIISKQDIQKEKPPISSEEIQKDKKSDNKK